MPFDHQTTSFGRLRFVLITTHQLQPKVIKLELVSPHTKVKDSAIQTFPDIFVQQNSASFVFEN